MQDAHTGGGGDGTFPPKGHADEAGRLNNLRNAIDSIERKLNDQQMTASVPPMAPSGADLSQIQQQLDRLSSQVGLGETTTGRITNRGQGIQQTVQLDQMKLANDLMAQFKVLREDLAGLKKDVQKPVAIPQRLMSEDIERIAKTMRAQPDDTAKSDAAFEKLGQELTQIRDQLHRELEASQQNSTAINERLDALTSGFDTVSLQAASSVAPRVDDLAAQLDSMRMSIEDLPQSLSISRIDQRLNEITSSLDRLPANFDQVPEKASLERRLDEIARALVAVANLEQKQPEIDLSAIERLETRLAALDQSVEKMAKTQRTPIEHDQVQALATRIEGLTERLGSFEKYAETGDLGGAAAMFAGPDTGMVEDHLKSLNTRLDEVMSNQSSSDQISKLEAQMAQILGHLARPTAPSIDFSPLVNKLGKIEGQIESQQKSSLDAVESAARQAVALMGPDDQSAKMIDALSVDLKKLQSATTGSSKQNSSYLEQMQDTLSRITDRLGSIEDTITHGNGAPAKEVLHAQAAATLPPAIGLDEVAQKKPAAITAPDITVDMNEKSQTTAIPVEPAPVEEPSGFDDAPIDTRVDETAFEAPAMAPAYPPQPDYDPTPAQDQLLEPGTAMPDVSRLVEEASMALDQQHADITEPQPAGEQDYSDNIKTDPVGAARRALQATTAEMKSGPVDDSVVQADMGKLASSTTDVSVVSRLRKPLMMAAAATLLFVLATFGYKTFLADGQPPALGQAPTTIEQPASDPMAVEPTVPGTAIEGEDESLLQIERQGSTRDVSPADETTEISIDDTMSAPAIQGETLMATPAPEAPEITTQVVEAAPEAVAPKPMEQPTVDVVDVSDDAGPAALVAAARQGEPRALYELGMRASEGKVQKRDMVAAAKWFELAAEAGLAPAQYSVGSLYEKGIGVAKNVTMATQWYDQAAAQGNARAMHNLAVIHAMGNDGKTDMDKAVRLFVQAGNYGIKDSQFNLGILYGQGMGVPQNLAQSYKWFAIAAKSGDTDAAAKRDEVATAMDKADLDAMRTEVAQWKAKSLDVSANKVDVPKEWKSTGKQASALDSTKRLIQSAQASLSERGFDVGTPDGVMGPRTARAIREFQAAADLPVTGKVDKALMKALNLNS